jgi:hypothetical protein
MGFREVEASRFLDNRHMKVILSILRSSRLYHQEIFQVIISVRDCVDPETMHPEGLCQWKIPKTPSGIVTATFRFKAQPLSQMRHLMSLWVLWGFNIDCLYNSVWCFIDHIVAVFFSIHCQRIDAGVHTFLGAKYQIKKDRVSALW